MIPKKVVDEINKRVDKKYPKERYGNTIRNDYRLLLKEGAKIAIKHVPYKSDMIIV